ncbi:hypothetical protein [Shewanella marina]|uniref:hypothetical protein n=1 Tax=Shewanella marina TaxID=487319 RepID=UPI0004720740|nr:hypothetical protein [Shewanella marina]
MFTSTIAMFNDYHDNQILNKNSQQEIHKSSQPFQTSKLLDVKVIANCANKILTVKIRMARVYAYHRDQSLLIVSNKNQQLKIKGRSTVNTFHANLVNKEILQLIKLARMPDTLLEVISYRSNDSVSSQQPLFGLAEQLENVNTYCAAD